MRAAPKSGAGSVRTLGKWYDFATTSALVVDRSHVYWMHNDDGPVLVRVDKNGGGEVTTRLPTRASGARLDVGPLRDGGDFIAIATEKYAGPMAWIDGSLYFVNDRGASGSGENLSVLRADAAVDAAEDLGAALGFVDRLLYDGRRRSLYWTTGFHWLVSKVVVYRLDGGAAPEVLFDKQDVMGGSAADADTLYWLSDHHVTRLAKEP